MHLELFFLHCGNQNFYRTIIEPLCSRFQTGSRQSENFKYVGFQITQTESKILLDQQDYIDSIEIPKIPIARRMKKTEPLNPEENTIYRSLVGALNWIVQNTRPDLSFELTYLSSKFDKGLLPYFRITLHNLAHRSCQDRQDLWIQTVLTVALTQHDP